MSADKALKTEDVVKATLKFFEDVLEKVGRVIEVNKNEDEWNLRVEVLEESEYMRRRGRGDLLAIYEVKVNSDLDITSYVRKSLRERESLEELREKE